MTDDSKEKRSDDEKDEALNISDDNHNSNATSPSEYSRFTKNEKWFIVCFTSFVGVFSPLTANIYLPALPSIAIAFHKSTELINLTLTMYMVLQGVAPMLWGPVSDHIGRRPISAACLLILSLSCIGLALVPTSAFWLLMLLRCLQAAGSASTIAIGAGVVGDISTRAERGGFFGIFTLGPMVGPAIGPIIGGALSQSLGWRALFWFLCISASICFVIIILFQPETLRAISDSGRLNIPIIYKPVIPIIGRNAPPAPASQEAKVKVPKNPFGLFLNPDVDVLLLMSAISCAVYYGVTATISTLFVETYPFLTETTIGLCYLSIGGGMIIGSSITGRLLDADYKRFKAQAQARIGEGEQVNLNQEEDFPLEKARLRLLPIYITLMAAASAGYGWCVQGKVNIAGPLILQFIIGYMSISIMNVASTLMIDLVPGQSSSVTACNNLIRCTLSAVLVSVIELMLKGMGIGWTYVLLGAILLTAIPVVYLSIRIGPKYRIKRQQERAEALARLAEAANNADEKA
ncbi:major facilitator superfamily domain-containing protein [Pholiota molesta]|nr:major facilitator superfamily domain-containing protein [Pholiota molesta]